MREPLKKAFGFALRPLHAYQERNTTKKEFDACCTLFNHLAMFQIEHAFVLIDEEIKISHEKFGLKILTHHKEKERTIILGALDQLGGVYAFRKNYHIIGHGYYQKFSQVVFNALEDELKYYFDITPKGEVKSRYNAHLMCVLGRIFNEIMDDNGPFIDPKKAKEKFTR